QSVLNNFVARIGTQELFRNQARRSGPCLDPQRIHWGRLAMKSIRKSPRSREETYDEAAEPLHWHSELDIDGNVIFVTDKIGYPPAGEPISGEIAAFALRHRRYRLDFVRQSCGAPKGST